MYSSFDFAFIKNYELKMLGRIFQKKKQSTQVGTKVVQK